MLKQTQKKYFSRLFILLATVVFVSAGCGGGGGGQKAQSQITLTVWKTFEDSENLRPVFEAFQKKNPNVEINYVKKNIDSYESDLINALASGSGPDVFSIHNDWLPKYLDKTTPAPEALFGFKEYKDAFVDAAVNDLTLDQKIYGVALSVDSLALYYNKDLLGSSGIAVPPKTWSELSSQVKQIKRSDGKGYFTRSGVAIGTNKNVNRAVDILNLFMLQQGAKAFDEDRTSAVFANQIEKNGNYINPGQDATEFYTSFADPGSLNYNWNMRSDYSIDAFANGRAAFLYGYSYLRSTLLAKNPNLNFDVTTAPQPNLQDPTVNFANYWGEVVSKQSKNQEAAWKFLKFISSKEALDIYYAQNKQPSSRKDLIELQIPDPEIGVFAHANLTAKTFYKPDQQKMDDIFGLMIDNIILKGESVREALEQAQQQADVLGRNNQ